MNISLVKNDAATGGILTLEVVKDDYAEQVEKNLRNLRMKANIPGFRKGHIPIGIIKKMYGKQALAEEINKKVSEKLYAYIRENTLDILGDPIPNESEQKEIDFDTQEDFEFKFDVAFSPEIRIELNKRDKLTYYQIMVDEKTVDEQLNAYRSNYGSYEHVENVEEKDLVKGTVTEWENDAPKEEGIVVQDAVLMPMYIKNEEEKNKFIGAGIGSVVVFNPHKAYEGSEAEIAAFLHVEKTVAGGITGDFKFEIEEITRHKEAEFNQEIFDKVLGEGVVDNEDAFREKIKEKLSEQFIPQSSSKFLMDAHPLLLKKAGNIVFADDILKRWLILSDEKNTKEKVDEEYPKIIDDLTRQLLKERIVKANDIKVEENDIKLFGRHAARIQFARYYGMPVAPDYLLDSFAQEMLKDRQTLQGVIDMAVEYKLVAWLKEKVKLEVKEVSPEEFNDLFKDEQAQ
ncbi:MAG: trigger factor [Tannerellaceae bacterium]|jgi:trigger factor|nr:trigger factor [Tannerellaceae bacterium]